MATPKEIKAIHDALEGCQKKLLAGEISGDVYMTNCAFFMPQILAYIKEQEGLD